ncbi:hypothetical protein BJ508DRAFT_211350 [Ascobolus immersus RN42]|uniref:YMC020W-like alpha/beta hydrolase domain-containing protein n=1 Tax=Ascobolus immersus RN42 TaxID=1160509 RepID=A0A3N4HZT7_ASCIM|nr:hypothetical protein BJ508DRAFT_211350 [Ascobolus immersus RN42]
MSEPTIPVPEVSSEPSDVAKAPDSAEPASDVKPISAVPPRPASWGFWPLVNRSTDTLQSNPPVAAGTGEVNDSSATPVVQPDKAKGKEPVNPIGKIDSKAQNAVIINPDNNKGKTEITITETGSSSATPSAAKKELQRLHKNSPQGPPNHILPSIDDCLWRKDQPRFLEKVSKLIWKKPEQQQHRHLHLATVPLKPKKAVAIGVHGFFPMRLVRTVLGEPTGTSKRFATHASNAIKRWADHNGISIEVENIALEGEGKVADRVEILWNLLGHWMDVVREADFVFVAAHSQGAVVGMMLLAKMIEQGVVDNARVGFLAMAGINNGPFYHLPTTLLTGSAKELFEFQRGDSTVSKKYIQAIRTVLAHNTKIIYVGSIDDQLVPLESSTFQNIHHPHIFRSVFVDGRVHAPDFLSHLVGFALKLRNLGWSDHGLIRELSTPLAGSLYSGEGHSRVYDDGQVYDLAVRFALETTDMPDIPLRVDKFELPAGTTNPFFLPWSMRGLLEEPYVRSELGHESRTLLEQFEAWKPTSKVLKDVKFRLEAVRSKL